MHGRTYDNVMVLVGKWVPYLFDLRAKIFVRVLEGPSPSQRAQRWLRGRLVPGGAGPPQLLLAARNSPVKR